MKAKGNILRFGLASFLTDVSSDMIQSVLPLFMSSVLGLDKVFIGLVEGIAASTASLLKLFFGWLSDILPRRKPLIIFGYVISSVCKPLMALAQNGYHVMAIRFGDRVGKGVRTSPRDALLAESVSPARRGFAFGFHRAMDSAGAVIGPVTASIFLAAGSGYRTLFAWAFLPALLSVLILFGIREGRRIPGLITGAGPERGKRVPLGKKFNVYLASCALFTLGNSSDAFIILRAHDLGLGVALIPLIWMVQNLFNSATAIPAGHMSDRIGRKKTILMGLSIYVLVYAGLAGADEPWHIWPLMMAYGAYYGCTEGAFRAFVPDLVPPEKLGYAFGLYHAVVGMSLLPASLITGFLWEGPGPRAAFMTGSVLALAAAVLLITVRAPRPLPGQSASSG